MLLTLLQESIISSTHQLTNIGNIIPSNIDHSNLLHIQQCNELPLSSSSLTRRLLFLFQPLCTIFCLAHLVVLSFLYIISFRLQSKSSALYVIHGRIQSVCNTLYFHFPLPKNFTLRWLLRVQGCQI